MKDTVISEKKLLNLKGNLVDVSDGAVMGILNVTTDSFYDGGRYLQDELILQQAGKMLDEGALIIDVGGYSSRPGATDISADLERHRVLKAIKLILNSFPDCYISVDTFRSSVAKAALEAGACMVNDISGGERDKNMYDVVAAYKVPYVLMHMRGTPQDMIHQTEYQDLLLDLMKYFAEKLQVLRSQGISDIIIDPGFGFAKNIDQNFQLLKNLSYFNVLRCPILVGISRKSMIYKTLGQRADDALNGTTVLNTLALLNQASILRVHDVKEAVECVKIFKRYNF